MSGRLSSQGSVIMINDGTLAGTAADIASATKASPCVITLSAAATPPIVAGAIIVPRGTGWNSIEGRPFKVSDVALLVVTLEDSDSSREVADLAAGATVEQPVWVEMCRSTMNLNNPAGATIDVSTLCDETHRIVSGMPAVGTWTANGFYDVSDAALPIVRAHYRSGDFLFFDVRMRDGSGLTFNGNVNTYDVTLAVNAAVATNLGGNVDGLVCFYETPPPGFVPLASKVSGLPPSTRTPPPAPAPQPAAAT